MDAVTYGSNLGTANKNREPSPTIWGRVPIDQILCGRANGIFQFDDFTDFPYITTPTITTQAAIGGKLGYKAFGSSGGTLVNSGKQWGEIVMTETDDNEGVSFATIALPYKIERANAHFACECRVKFNNIADNDTGFFFGLSGLVTLSATVPISATGTLVDGNFVGFHRREGDGDQIDTCFRADDAGSTVDAVSYVDTDAINSRNASSGSALVADTGSNDSAAYIKLGMTFNCDTAEFVWYINGIPCPTKQTVQTAAGTVFPNDVPMGLIVALLCGSNNDSIVTLDWIGAAAFTGGF